MHPYTEKFEFMSTRTLNEMHLQITLLQVLLARTGVHPVRRDVSFFLTMKVDFVEGVNDIHACRATCFIANPCEIVVL